MPPRYRIIRILNRLVMKSARMTATAIHEALAGDGGADIKPNLARKWVKRCAEQGAVDVEPGAQHPTHFTYALSGHLMRDDASAIRHMVEAYGIKKVTEYAKFVDRHPDMATQEAS